MSSVRNILAGAALSFAALGFLGSAPAQAGVVVKSSGPSAETYPVGKKLDDAASVTLRTGDSITVLTGSGTRVISGPGTHRVGARGASKRTATMQASSLSRASDEQLARWQRLRALCQVIVSRPGLIPRTPLRQETHLSVSVHLSIKWFWIQVCACIVRL